LEKLEIHILASVHELRVDFAISELTVNLPRACPRHLGGPESMARTGVIDQNIIDMTSGNGSTNIV
jgi:hypothetical protein